MVLAFVFPGQGSQTAGMGADLASTWPVCAQTFAEADETLGFALSKICFTGTDQELQMTANAQPAILTTSIAAFRVLAAEGIRPAAVAGHSLGEYSALVAAGSLSFRDALTLVRKRGIYMQEAVPLGVGAMAAIMGLELERLEQICREASDKTTVSPANLNAPGQVVISGHADAVDRAIALAQERGARRALKLAVSAPFHCDLMQPAADRLAADLAATRFDDLTVPLVANISAAPLRTGSEARDALIRQVTGAVRWEQSVRTLASMGVTRALEVGPGRVLMGLIKRIESSIACAPAGDAATLTTAKEFAA